MVSSVRRLSRLSWPRSYPLVQFPNIPLAVALVASLAGGHLDGHAHALARALFFVGFAVWAALELGEGVNRFRKALGAVAMVYIVMRLGATLDTT